MTEPTPKEPIPQASAIPYRGSGDALELCVITSIKKGRWGFPKGIIDPGETYVETALKEACEEAGLGGHILRPPVGTYWYSKWGTTLNVIVVLMHVTHCDDYWEEAELRQREWVPPAVALRLVSRPEVNRVLEAALARLREIGKLTSGTGGGTG